MLVGVPGFLEESATVIIPVAEEGNVLRLSEGVCREHTVEDSAKSSSVNSHLQEVIQ